MLRQTTKKILRTSFVQWPVGLVAGSSVWKTIARQVKQVKPDILITNEMPFGSWLSAKERYDAVAAAENVEQHEAGLEALRALGVPLVLSSRPVPAGNRIANEAFALEGDTYRFLHHKHYFPAEPGWHEAEWFRTGVAGFELHELAGLRVGVLLCTEAMFNERARAYGRAGADLILVLRATGRDAVAWKAACAMAAVVSGGYVVSSNRVGPEPNGGPTFSGVGMAYRPGGELIAETLVAQPLVTFELDPELACKARGRYPCYVTEVVQMAKD